MLESMTAYGTVDFELSNYKYTMEIRSVNHRFFEFKFRSPSYLYRFESLVRDAIKSGLQRGSIECYIKPSKTAAKNSETGVEVDYSLMGEYLKALEEAKNRFGIEGKMGLSDLLRLPNLFTVKEPELNEELMEKEILAASKKCAGVVKEMQKKEGEKLKSAMEQHLIQIENNTTGIHGRSAELFETSFKKIKNRLSELLSDANNIPTDRITSEAGILAEKLDISEEIERLGSHFAQFRETLKNNNVEPVGKKLDFIVQEINREINTIASKAEDTSVVYTAIESKTLTEKIREQVQNVK